MPQRVILTCKVCKLPTHICTCTKKKVEELQTTLDSVMHSVDKWLTPEQIEKNPEPATRASVAREVTLREIERLDNILRNIEGRGMIHQEDLKKRRERLTDFQIGVSNGWIRAAEVAANRHKK